MASLSESTSIKCISPILPVADMEESIAFYRNVLGFEVSMESPDYSVVGRDGVSLHLTKTSGEAALEAARNHISFYLEVDDIAPLWEHVQTFKGQWEIRDLFDREYGMREFHIKDPSGCLIFVGQKTT